MTISANVDYPKSLNELSHNLPSVESAFALDDLVWEHFTFDPLNHTLSANRETRSLLTMVNDLSGGLKGASVLELGPYEGYDTAYLEKLGVSDITAIEGNPRNLIKCLIVKNYYQLNKSQFMLGDFTKHLADTNKRYDFILASGVLYHLLDPFTALENITKLTNSIAICTTYFHPSLQFFKFTGNTREVNFPGLDPLILHERTNTSQTNSKKHGMNQNAWMFTTDGLFKYLEYKGFSYQVLNKREDRKLGAPRIQIYASKPK